MGHTARGPREGRTTVLEGHEEDFEGLKIEVQILQAKLEDLENWMRHSNIRVRGLPETIVDL